MRAVLSRLLPLVLLVLLMAAGPAPAQSRAWWLGGVVGSGAASAQTDPAPAPAETGIDYRAWATFAGQTERMISDPTTVSDRLESLRGELAAWRERFLQAQSANKPRIDTLREQIAALGPAPAEGSTEPPELAERRAELNTQLAAAQAPAIAAEEAYRRADGLIHEADSILRARDASKLVRRDPAPVNPANWTMAAAALSGFATDLWADLSASWADPARRSSLVQAAPLLLGELLIAALLLWQGRRWIDRVIQRLQDRLPTGWWGVVELPLSLTQVILPVAALLFLTSALEQTGFLGPLAESIATDGVMTAGLVISVMLWIGWHVFPADERLTQVVVLPAPRRAEGRLHVTLAAMAMGAEALLAPAFTAGAYGVAAVSTVNYPVTALIGLLLFRLGQLLRQSAAIENDGQETPGFRPLILTILGKAAMAIGIVGPILGAIGYIALADAMVRPALSTLGLLAVVALLQRLIYDIYAVVTRGDPRLARDALIPVLISFALVLAAIPVLALLWGVRSADLWEYWTRFREGFRLGDTRISPTDFVMLGVIFGIGYGVTRLMQGALRTTILPKTSLDTGGKNAIVAGVGYVGIVLAALAAITSTGLDLSNLAIVAGALSVGIGFGLQNIVSNFVSGIILLIERPVAEGDWIEVGGIQGIVRGISVRSTKVETFDRTTVIVPNADLISGQVTNWTGFNLNGRLIVPVGVAYGTDTRKVERILREIAEAQPLVVLNPPPAVPFVGFGADSLNFEIRAILRDINFMLSVRSEINHQIAARFAEEGIEIPFAQRDLWIRNPEALTGRAAERPAAALPPEPSSVANPLRDDETLREEPGVSDHAPGYGREDERD
ncbi:Small-conductance mechanosensitive channel [Gemmobacter megaterium]|uniref:Small-conductance mechanosensitive channel n=1 Tax=Gemmobacter megaterium TaxID=1086013 RepID=A0A1N7K0G5_9RHOB|nr:DUF3772 domain-containing protein [Gemmobacter megaterium]GGD99794.1 mechanosensitive ion channel protein MscS [Gemmobacter megaterium]SIS55041.1 Small-conductance mechanosensitive channel [Gemmobacter megaterium]